MPSPAFIGADALEEAIHAHGDRMALLGPKPIDRIIASLKVDVAEFHAAAQAVTDHRHPAGSDRGPYSTGLIDGFVIGVRAARAAGGDRG